ncbi:unnamed protein product [Dibothriocephalus latus]|uniref:Origin recognition complex subunit 3 N-terminal domain-containing protein n=1 Tax=Dibothriocephalus latus TaxID=60516 RepID=A0A3P6UC73_DIBLA|nr:unnamed protein product [Dibothriocephalus latus]
MEVFAKTRQCSASLPSSNELAFTQDWSNITKAVERKLSTVSQNLTRSVAGYVVKVSGEASISSGQIPTALVLASVNTPDHSALYGQLRELIISEGGIVALLESDTDVSTARGIIAAMYNQLNSSNEPSFSELEQNSPKRRSTLDLPTSLKSTFLAISLWYDVNLLFPPPLQILELMTDISANQKLKSRKPLLPQTSNHPTEAALTKQKTAATPSHYHKRTTMDRRKSATPKKDAVSAIAAVPKVSKRLSMNVRNSSSGGTANAPVLRPLVVVIPAIETISATVLRDFIELAFVYSSTCATSQPSSDEGNCLLGRQNMFGALPIRFVFGLSGAADLGLEVRCDAMTLSRLAIKRFKIPSPAVFLQAALTEMIHTPGFRMSRCMLNFVVDSVYMCVDYSIENFLKRTKACMLLHYQNLRHPQLLQALDISSSYIHSLNYEDLTELVATYPSLAEIVAEAPADILCARLTECLKSHWLSQLLLPRILSWILALFACLEIRPLPSTVSCVPKPLIEELGHAHPNFYP